MTFSQTDSTEVVGYHDVTEPAATERQMVAAQQQHQNLSKPLPAHTQKDTIAQLSLQDDNIIQASENDSDTLQLYEEELSENSDSTGMPLYYKENCFFPDSLLNSNIAGGQNGVAGDPIPYTIRNDNVITSVLLLCFILVLIGLSKTGRLITRQTKGFFNEHRRHTAEYTETSNELRFQLFLVLQTCLLLSLLSFIFTQQLVDTTFFILSNYMQLTAFFCVFALYFIGKSLLYWIVNSVFFDKQSNTIWFKSFLFITSVEGIALFPLVVVLSYIEMPILYGALYLGFVIIIVRILLLYKCFVTFFRQKIFCLQIILYLCTLEIIPLLFLWGTLVNMIDCFKINIGF
ncbi:MAG: DUF4271 domain-containing protein [Prevotella sp.]|nr:DUF4271 domain-containing protein [Prevotella sp.]